MRREFHVRFCESPGVQFPRATRLIILVAAPTGPEQFEQAREVAMREKEELAALLKSELGLELSETKTLVTPVTEPMRFLGHHVRVRRHPVKGIMVVATLVPRTASHKLRERIKDLFRNVTFGKSLANCYRARLLTSFAAA
jgi:RNA-directed DNA polymerase